MSQGEGGRVCVSLSSHSGRVDEAPLGVVIAAVFVAGTSVESSGGRRCALLRDLIFTATSVCLSGVSPRRMGESVERARFPPFPTKQPANNWRDSRALSTSASSLSPSRSAKEGGRATALIPTGGALPSTRRR
uniref:Uncharacterized protein n=1 Tax=Plectus sambesii TaxID=2011161 RepID=A0A914WZD2_9BILA